MNKQTYSQKHAPKVPWGSCERATKRACFTIVMLHNGLMRLNQKVRPTSHTYALLQCVLRGVLTLKIPKRKSVLQISG